MLLTSKTPVMKRILIIMITLSLLTGINGIHAQTTAAKLDQVKLFKQMHGTWQYEFAPDSFIIWEIKPYGNGFEGYYKFTTKGEPYREVKQLSGFTPDRETFATFTLFPGGGFIVFTGKFTSRNQLYSEARDFDNPEKVLSKKEYEFIDADTFTVTRVFGGLGARPGTYHRIKK
jgi:hypothetical protein